MTISIINDCRDENAAGRQQARVQALFGVQPIFIGVDNDLEAAGNLIDALDAHDESKGVILVNVAPRHGQAKKWPNGTPFGYFFYRNTIVVSSIDGYVLSLVKKFSLVPAIKVLDTAKAVKEMVSSKFIPADLGPHITDTQFRSYEFTPRVAAYLNQQGDFKASDSLLIKDIPDAPTAVWYIDNFGNCKLTLLSDADFVDDQSFTLQGKHIAVHNRLKDVPNNEAALIVGSSGIGDKRFLELVLQGGSAAKRLNLTIGQLLN